MTQCDLPRFISGPSSGCNLNLGAEQLSRDIVDSAGVRSRDDQSRLWELDSTRIFEILSESVADDVRPDPSPRGDVFERFVDHPDDGNALHGHANHRRHVLQLI